MVEDSAIGQHTTALEAQHGDEEANTCSNGILQRRRHKFEYQLTEVANAKQHKQDSFNQHGRQRKLPGITQRQADRLNKKDVERETWRLTKRTLGKKSHEQRANDGGQDRGCEHGVNGEAHTSQRLEHGWQQGQDINHGGESGQTGDNLRLKAMAMNGEAHQSEEFFFHTSK